MLSRGGRRAGPSPRSAGRRPHRCRWHPVGRRRAAAGRRVPAGCHTHGARDRRWRPGDLRHTTGPAESCCLPALTRFTGCGCTGPGRHLRSRACAHDSLCDPRCHDRARPVVRSSEGCESGRIGTLGKRVWGNPPWVRIPLPPHSTQHGRRIQAVRSSSIRPSFTSRATARLPGPWSSHPLLAREHDREPVAVSPAAVTAGCGGDRAGACFLGSTPPAGVNGARGDGTKASLTRCWPARIPVRHGRARPASPPGRTRPPSCP
jgi:hypothetical protein